MASRDNAISTQALRTRAFELHERGDLAAAEAAYRETLRRVPDDGEVRTAFAAIALQSGRYDLALELLRAALRVRETAAAHGYLGNALLGLSRSQEALASYERAIALDARHAPAHFNRGNVLRSLGRGPEALESFERAIALWPHFFDAHMRRGEVLIELKRWNEALASFDRAIALKADCVPAHINRGVILRLLRRPAEALANQETALALAPNSFEALANRAAVLLDLGRFAEALAGCDLILEQHSKRAADVHVHRADALAGLDRYAEALELYDQVGASRPGDIEAHLGRARVLMLMRRFADALCACDEAINRAPGNCDAYCIRGGALRECARLDEAIASFQSAMSLRPGDGTIEFDAGCLYLLAGRFEQGWDLYAKRPKLGEILAARSLAKPRWAGVESLSGKTLFVYTDQGLGDALQFCRYAGLAQARGARVIMAVQTGLRRIMSGLGATLQLLSETETPAAFDFHCPLSDLPRAFGTGLQSIPAGVPYLFAEKQRVAHWKQRLGTHGFKIGICWQGSSLKAGCGRSFPLRALQRVSGIPGVRLISLQKGEGVQQLAALPAAMPVETLGEEFDAGPDALLDTAAVMENLDLVITCDTSIAHVAGALGRPAWVALKYVPDWRWMLDRDDSPWYPTLRLFRQRTDGQWGDVFDSMFSNLKEVVS